MTASNTAPSNSPSAAFVSRHIGPSPNEVADMLKEVGAHTLDALIDETLPKSIRQKNALEIGPALSETGVIAHMKAIAGKNERFTSLIGQGYHGTVLPPVISRNILENPAWYTAYTPYQPEISQGRLEALINFQTAMADLAGLEIANASLLDEATAAAEAMAMARRVSKNKPDTFFVDADTHPQTIAVIRTRAEPLGWDVVVGDPETELNPEEVFGALLSYPGTSGAVRDLTGIIKGLKGAGAVAAVAADPLALTLLTSPGEMGADIVIGSTQRFGVAMGYGGPHAAYMATTDAFKRVLPGRLIGVSVDARGKPAYRLALQTREQHIRREKATSNICTAQVLLAVIASMYCVYHGPDGIRRIAREVHSRTAILAAGLKQAGFAPLNETFFDTLTVGAGDRANDILTAARKSRINLRDFGDGRIGIALDETTTDATIEAVLAAFGSDAKVAELAGDAGEGLPADLKRRSDYLTHPVFHMHRSETDMLRYMRKLSDKDLALDRAMIPLGSCTMKLNATTEMLPITWPEFAELHPFAPADQALGYSEMFEALSDALCAITGYDAISLQPNSGAQGEYAGLLAIRAFHRANGEGHRKVCLIPSSAHGTNPASAQMAGMDVVIVACDEAGNVDVADLEKKAEAHKDDLAAIMITYPSTHGVFEEEIVKICAIVHDHGGQVYLDGANLNAQVGIARPGKYGADVSHLNLHKTFCIPHGGGGPGMGPIGVREHLIPFLPGHPALDGGDSPVGAVSAAPFGSASILPISYAYAKMMGGDGLKRATEIAILNANYIAERLENHFPVLYRNEKRRVAHECIIDPRALKASAGVTVDDIAKRLIDFGFHAPTMSFPVPGTLMIEPTESESKRELDRFIDAMIAIRAEIEEVEKGSYSIEESPLRNAPHTVEDMAEDDWTRPYKRSLGCLPGGMEAGSKYFAPVGRVDNVYGDRNLVCSCPPLEDYQEAAE
ncbi:aminomethyl-transferring glycine dehydrogenase [Cucumibacter marinus]|uniref:aminomethyl-transferring glycine dehydrogenase n=1 Tax=Cucumibacter marinus TaxID=1121252 RepID=UPI0004278643|nr:aminomethyl-transferring glycine dehydrogenase [Cucumibacter marinus]